MKRKTALYKLFKAQYFLIFIVLILVFSNISAQDNDAFLFAFNDKVGDVYSLNSFVNQIVFVDEQLDGEYEYKYEGELKVVEKLGTSSRLKGYYYAYSKPINSTDPYQIINDSTAKTEFIRKPNGEMIIDKSYLYPTVRNVPLFPDRKVRVGEEWESKAVEVMDFASLGAKDPYRIPLNVLYKYLGDEIFQERKVAVIHIKYYFEYDMFEKPDPNSTKVRPIFLTGLFEGKYYWDKEKSMPLFYEADTVFTYLLKNSLVLEVRSSEYGEVRKKSPNVAINDNIDTVDDDRKGEIAQDIKDELIDKKLDDNFDVVEKDNGVSINLGDILFDFNSYKLRPDSIEKLDEIVKILKRYENFNMLIEGHTDNIGDKSFNQKLSENRAIAVRDYLVLKGINSDKLTPIGYGEENPIADNSTEEGRALNRRVEVTIITTID